MKIIKLIKKIFKKEEKCKCPSGCLCGKCGSCNPKNEKSPEQDMIEKKVEIEIKKVEDPQD